MVTLNASFWYYCSFSSKKQTFLWTVIYLSYVLVYQMIALELLNDCGLIYHQNVTETLT